MNKGFALVLIVMAVAVIAVAGIGVFAMKGNLSLKEGPTPTPYTYEQMMKNTPAPVSDNSDLKTIEAELDTSVVGSPDGDLMELESSASAL